MSTDRELLEMAAKAAGISIVRSRLEDPMWRDMLLEPKHGIGIGWNPLADDGDALRLAGKLYIIITYDIPHSSWVSAGQRMGPFFNETISIVDFREHDAVVQAATRRAIVRAAAEIGRNMK